MSRSIDSNYEYFPADSVNDCSLRRVRSLAGRIRVIFITQAEFAGTDRHQRDETSRAA